MANDSTSAGFLSPASVPLYSDGLDDALQAAIVGITGIPGSLVRPRWQPEPPNQPPFSTDWCAFGVTRTDSDIFSYTNTDELDQGFGVVAIERTEEITVLHSFYGPNSDAYCARLRAGLDLSQNRDTLTTSGIALVAVQEALKLPALLQKKWVKRVDVTIIYRRRVSWQYPVNALTSGQAGLDNELYTTPINITNP